MKALMVGTALDTNGQKQRFVEAARRWGDDPSVLKALVIGKWDGAGIPVRLAEAAEKGEGLSIRAAHRATAYFDFPTDIIWSRSSHAQVQQLAEEADVIHLTNDTKAYVQFRLSRLHKPALLHHHGTLFRSLHDDGASRDRLLMEARRYHMVNAVSTIDLQRPAPDILHWLPAPIDVDAMQQMRNLAPRSDGVMRVMSAPTRRDLKSTARLIAAVERLKADGLAVELVLVESRSWAECLAVKATADIYFDQVAVPSESYPGGYGCNAIEAWAMGIPVVAGADEWTTARMRKLWKLRPSSPMPYHEATEDTIADALRSLVTDPALRAQASARGLKHVHKYHAEKPALKRLAELYGMAIRKAAAAPRDAWVGPVEDTPGVFESERGNLSLRLGSRSVTFTEGRLVVDDGDLAGRIRRLSRMRPDYRIREVEAVA